MKTSPDFSLSRPLEGALLRVLSLGAGVQSSTLALMAAEGLIGPMPTAAIFADTQAEPEGVYEHLRWLIVKLPFPVHIVTAGSLRQEIIDAAAGLRGAWGRPPLFIRNGDGSVGMTNRQCTQDYKLEPIRKRVRQMLGLRPRQRSPKVKLVEQWIGISTDEIVRMKHDLQPFVQNRWPLIEMGMSRRDCVAWLAERGWNPPKSACTFCPYHSDAMWRDMRDNDPASWRDAVAVDDVLREGLQLQMRGDPYIHRSCVPLRDVDLSTSEERGQSAFGFTQECDGMCGV